MTRIHTTGRDHWSPPHTSSLQRERADPSWYDDDPSGQHAITGLLAGLVPGLAIALVIGCLWLIANGGGL